VCVCVSVHLRVCTGGISAAVADVGVRDIVFIETHTGTMLPAQTQLTLGRETERDRDVKLKK